MQASIVFAKKDETAPLYAKYQGQHNPPPAHISLSLETGSVDADYSGTVGNGMSPDVWHDRTLQWPVNPLLSGSQVMELLTDLLPTLQIILDGSEVEWDGSNFVGKVSGAEAIAAEETLRDKSEYGLGNDLETNLITGLGEWIASGGRECWLPGESENIREYIDNLDLGYYVAHESVEETLIVLWREELYSGNDIPKNVAQFLLAGDHCAGSEWLDELKEFAGVSE